VDMQDMEKVWHELQFNPTAPVDVPFKADLFRPAPKSVQILRQLSRKGQSYVDCAAREQAGRDKFVLGLPNDACEMAPLLAHAHGNLGSGPLLAPNIGEGGSRPVGSTTAPDLPIESQYFEGTREPVTSSAVAAANAEEQEGAKRDTVPPMMTSRMVDSTTANVSEQAGQLFPTVPPPGTNAGSGEFVSESTVALLEEMLAEDQRRVVGDTADGQITAVRPRPSSPVRVRQNATASRSN